MVARKMWAPLRALIGTVALTATITASADTAPDPQQAQALVKDVTDRVLAVLEEHSGEGEMDVEAVTEQINDIVMPHLDFVTMTRLAVGRHWRQASRDQKRTLVTEFRDLLVRTYSASLDEFANQQLEFLPLRPSPHEDRVTVRSRVIRADGPPIPVDYGLHYDDGEWQLYDIVAEGVSLVTTYRSSFATTVQRDGIQGLIDELQRKNATGETSPEAPGTS